MSDARVIMHVDLDAFFVAVEQARRPELRGRPVIVGGDPDGRGVVATASYEARPFGVFSGQPLRTAKRLCPQAIFLRGDYAEYQRVSRAFHDILRAYSPLVEPAGLDEAFLDLTGCAPIVEVRCGVWLSGRPDGELARAAGDAVRRDVRETLGLAASVGVASGRATAKIASDAAKPDGLLVVPPGTDAAFLAPRPARHLPGVGPKAEAQLARLGVRTIGQLAAAPPAQLRAVFGSWGPALRERAQGIDPTPVAAGRDAVKSVSREGTYAHDVDDSAVLRASLRGYAESVGAELRRLGRRARCVTLKLRYGDFTTITRSRTLEGATHADETLYETSVALLSRALGQDGRAVRLIGLGASALTEDATQLGLFEPQGRRSERLPEAFDRVRAKYGHRALQTGLTFFDPYVSSPDWAPERRTGLSSQLGRAQDRDQDEEPRGSRRRD